MLLSAVLGATYFNGVLSWILFTLRIVSMLPYHLFFCNDPSEVADMNQSFDVLLTCWVRLPTWLNSELL